MGANFYPTLLYEVAIFRVNISDSYGGLDSVPRSLLPSESAVTITRAVCIERARMQIRDGDRQPRGEPAGFSQNAG